MISFSVAYMSDELLMKVSFGCRNQIFSDNALAQKHEDLARAKSMELVAPESKL